MGEKGKKEKKYAESRGKFVGKRMEKEVEVKG